MRLHVAVTFALLMSTPTLGAGCSSFSVDQFLAPVGYFTESMAPVELGDNGRLTLVHRDDPGIGASFELIEVPSDAGMTRSEYIRSLELQLKDRSAAIERVGSVPQSAVHPYDPIASTIRMTNVDGQFAGETEMRLTSTCKLNVNWNGSEAPLLASRSVELIAAVDAVRNLASSLVQPADFLDETIVPVGTAPLLIGLLGPLGAALLFCLPNAGGVRSRRVPGYSRAVAGFAAVVAVSAVGLCIPAYADGIADMRYLDSLSLLLVLAACCLAAAIVGHRYLMLYAASLMFTAGTSLAVSAYFGWLPDAPTGIAAAILLAVSGTASLAIWQFMPIVVRNRRRPA